MEASIIVPFDLEVGADGVKLCSVLRKAPSLEFGRRLFLRGPTASAMTAAQSWRTVTLVVGLARDAAAVYAAYSAATADWRQLRGTVPENV